MGRGGGKKWREVDTNGKVGHRRREKRERGAERESLGLRQGEMGASGTAGRWGEEPEGSA